MRDTPIQRLLWGAVLALLASAPSGAGSGAWAQVTAARSELILSDAVDRALAYHPTVLAARAGFGAASASAGAAKSQRFPQLSAYALLTRFQQPMIIAPLHRFDVNRRPDFDRTLIGGQATLGYTLFDGGARGARIYGTRAEAAAVGYERHSTELALIANVTRAYLQVLTARDVLNAHDRQIAALEAERQRVSRLLREGAAARVELLRVDAAVAQAESDRVATSTAQEVAERNLSRLIGADPAETQAARLVAIEFRDTAAIEDRPALLARAESANPDLQRARRRLEAAQSGRRVASAAWFPQLALFGGYTGFGSASGDFTAEWQAGARLSYPIFTGGARSSAVARATALAERARQEVRLAALTMREGVDRAISAVQGSRARIVAVARAVDHLTEVSRIERLALDEGTGTQTDYLRAEAELLRVRAALIEARHSEIAARVELARVVADLTPDWLDRSLEIRP